MARKQIPLCNWFGPDPSENELIGTDQEWRSEIYFPTTCRVWLVAEPHLSMPYFDLTLRLAPVAGEFGARPQWWDEFETQGYTDACTFLDIPSLPFEVRHAAKVMSWLMHEGIAPGQPFQVAVAMPYWYRCSYEYDEYDANYYAELVAVAPLDLEEGRRRWAWFVHHRERAIAAFEARLAAERERSRTDLAAMSLCKDWFFDGDPQFNKIGGYIARLYSRHGNRLLAEGRDEGRDPLHTWKRVTNPSWDVALERLIEKAGAVNPALTPDYIRAMPIRR